MKLKSISSLVAEPMRAGMVLIVILAGVFIAQAFVEEAARVLFEPELDPQELRAARVPEAQRRERLARFEKRFLPDGSVHLVEEIRVPANLDDSQREVRVHDPNGQVLWVGPRKDLPYSYISWATSISSSGPSSHTGLRLAEYEAIGVEFSRALVAPVVSSKGDVLERWEYDPGRTCFVGRDAAGATVGYLGAKGFVSSASDAVPFARLRFTSAWCPSDSRSPTLFWQTTDRLYEIDFEDRSCEVVLDAGGQEIVQVAMRHWRRLRGRPADERPLISAVTKQGRMLVRLLEPEKDIAVDLPADWDFRSVYVTLSGDALLLKNFGRDFRVPTITMTVDERATWRSEHLDKPLRHWVELYRVEADGGLSRLGRFDWNRSLSSRALSWQRQADASYESIRKCVTIVSPPVAEAVWRLHYKRVLAEAARFSDVSYVDLIVNETVGRSVPTSKLLNWPLALLLAGIVFWHGLPRRRSWGGLIGWGVLTAMFNLAGFLTYLALNHRPVIRCAACGRRRGLDRPDCPACAAPLAEPTPIPCDLPLIKPAPS